MEKNDVSRCGLNYRTPLLALLCPFYRLYAGGAFVTEVVCSIALVVSPLVQKMLIDSVNAGDKTGTIRSVIYLAAAIGVTILCQTVSYLIRFRLGVEARCRLKSVVFHSLLGLPESFLRERGGGYFFNRLQTDSSEIVGFYAGNALLQFSDFLKFLFSLFAMVWINWKCTLAVLPFLLFQFLIYSSYRKKQYRLGSKMQECTASERYRMQEYLSGHTTLKTHNAAEQAAQKIDQGFARWKMLSFQKLFHENKFRVLLTAPYYVCCGGIVVYGLNQVLEHVWSLGGLWALLMLIKQVFSPVQRFAIARFQMQQVRSAWDRLRKICASASESGTEADGISCSLKGDVVFSHVRFAYDQERTLFRDLNMTIRSNELFFLTGDNGTGKTTLFQLFLRLYDPLEGKITIGGRENTSFPLTAYRSRIGYLGQTSEFFPGTIRENLLLGSSHTDDEIMSIFRLLKSEDLILHRTDGLNSVMTERGQNFSGGERLRLALVRELLRDTDILLLDEPAANLDYDARQNFYELLPLLQGKRTTIVILHDRPPMLEKYSTCHLCAPGCKTAMGSPMKP